MFSRKQIFKTDVFWPNVYIPLTQGIGWRVKRSSKFSAYKWTAAIRKEKHIRVCSSWKVANMFWVAKNTLRQNTKWLPLEIKSLNKESFYNSFPRSNKWHHVHDIIKATLRFWSHSRRTFLTFRKHLKRMGSKFKDQNIFSFLDLNPIFMIVPLVKVFHLFLSTVESLL